MDQNVINGLFTVCGFLGGWVLKILWDAISDLKVDMRQIERDLPEVYLRKDDWKEDMRQLREDMQRNFDKIEHTLDILFTKIDAK